MCLSSEVLKRLADKGLLSKHLMELSSHYATFAFYYARDVLKGRWLAAEPYILKDPEESYWYARHVIGGRWPEAEPTLANSEMSEWPYRYAVYVLKRSGGAAIRWAERWREAHPDQDRLS